MGRLRTHTANCIKSWNYLEVDAGSMGRQQFFSKFIFLDHKFEIDVYILTTLGVHNLLFFLLPLCLLHLYPPFLSVFLDLFDFLQMSQLLVTSSHFKILTQITYTKNNLALCQPLAPNTQILVTINSQRMSQIKHPETMPFLDELRYSNILTPNNILKRIY